MLPIKVVDKYVYCYSGNNYYLSNMFKIVGIGYVIIKKSDRCINMLSSI